MKTHHKRIHTITDQMLWNWITLQCIALHSNRKPNKSFFSSRIQHNKTYNWSRSCSHFFSFSIVSFYHQWFFCCSSILYIRFSGETFTRLTHDRHSRLSFLKFFNFYLFYFALHSRVQLPRLSLRPFVRYRICFLLCWFVHIFRSIVACLHLFQRKHFR